MRANEHCASCKKTEKRAAVHQKSSNHHAIKTIHEGEGLGGRGTVALAHVLSHRLNAMKGMHHSGHGREAAQHRRVDFYALFSQAWLIGHLRLSNQQSHRPLACHLSSTSYGNRKYVNFRFPYEAIKKS